MRIGQRIDAAYEACKQVIRKDENQSFVHLALGDHIERIASKHKLTRSEVQELMARAIENYDLALNPVAMRVQK